MQRNNLSQYTYYYPKVNKNWLEKNGFRYNKSLSVSNECEIYTLRFPVISWNMYVTVEAEIMFNVTDNIAHINCYDKGTRSIYAAWYTNYYGNYTSIVDKINDVIEKKINKMGFIISSKKRDTLFSIPEKEKNE